MHANHSVGEEQGTPLVGKETLSLQIVGGKKNAGHSICQRIQKAW